MSDEERALNWILERAAKDVARAYGSCCCTYACQHDEWAKEEREEFEIYANLLRKKLGVAEEDYEGTRRALREQEAKRQEEILARVKAETEERERKLLRELQKKYQG